MDEEEGWGWGWMNAIPASLWWLSTIWFWPNQSTKCYYFYHHHHHHFRHGDTVLCSIYIVHWQLVASQVRFEHLLHRSIHTSDSFVAKWFLPWIFISQNRSHFIAAGSFVVLCASMFVLFSLLYEICFWFYFNRCPASMIKYDTERLLSSPVCRRIRFLMRMNLFSNRSTSKFEKKTGHFISVYVHDMLHVYLGPYLSKKLYGIRSSR